MRLFVNILTPNDKYSRSKSECLTQPIQMKLSQNQKIFSWFFSAFPKSTWKLEYFEKKKWDSEFICFWNYRLQKAEIRKCPKSAPSEQLCTVNMLKRPKHFLNLQSSIFLMFFDTLKENEFQELFFSTIYILDTVC